MIKYENIKVPEELYFYMMLGIKYGYLTKNRDIIVNDRIMFNNDFIYNNYMLQDNDDLLKYKIGICYDQVEFARCWFVNNNYDVITYYGQMGNNVKNSHSFIAYKDKEIGNTWNWFETTWGNQMGIHRYKDLDELFRASVSLYMNEVSRDRSFLKNDLFLYSFDAPKRHSSLKEYITNVNRGKKLSLRVGG